jgi:hypothetical protein
VTHELGDVIVGRMLHDVLRAAGMDNAATFQDGDLIAELQRLVEVVTDEQDGSLSGSSAENGSSISRMSASVANARASPTRCCMPPDSSWQ